MNEMCDVELLDDLTGKATNSELNKLLSEYKKLKSSSCDIEVMTDVLIKQYPNELLSVILNRDTIGEIEMHYLKAVIQLGCVYSGLICCGLLYDSKEYNYYSNKLCKEIDSMLIVIS